MGQLFELIADYALKKLDDYYNECHVCNRTNLDLYQYQGKWKREDGQIDDDIYAVCADCIHTKDLSHGCDSEYIKTIEKYLITSSLTIDEQELKKNELIEKYQKTPDVPTFLQYEDRPLCCSDITEFIGHPTDKEELYKMTENVIYWEKQIKEKSKSYDFRKFGNPESFNDVASFKCKHCGKQYFTFQFT
jgi:uncharacterized protein CbrC (UPF0167 family)